MQRTVRGWFWIFVLALALAGTAHAATQNFDSTASGTVLTNQFAAQGVVFDGFTVDSQTYGGAVIVPSPLNYIMINNATGGSFSFKVGSVDAVTNNPVTFNLLGLNADGGCYGGATVNALDINGSKIATANIPPVGPNQFRAVTLFGTQLAGLHTLQFVYIGGPNCGGGGLFGIDDLSFDTPVTPAPPTLTKTFGPDPELFFTSTTLTFKVTNPVGNPGLMKNLAFTDTLASGLQVATPNGLTGSCGGGTITATAGSSVISLAGATLAAGASCTFSVQVAGTAVGLQTNTTGTITADGGLVGNTATATTNVDYMYLLWWFS